MDDQERIVRQFEDYLLAQRGLETVGNIPFQHNGKDVIAYPYLRASNRSLINLFAVAKDVLGASLNPFRFLEVGCGIGTKCELARMNGFDSHGIDLLSDYVNLAQSVFPNCSFQTANALEFDYGGFDLVYYHVPFFDDHLLIELESRVLTHLKVGGLLVVTQTSRQLTGVLDGQVDSTLGFEIDRCLVEADIGRLVIVRKGNLED